MRMQEVNQVSGVRERCMPGVGATHPSGVSASAPPRWSLPPPAYHGIQKIYGTDISLIPTRYKPDQFSIIL